MSQIDPYARSIEILDVDYDDYLVLYSCNEESDEFDYNGISRSTLERQGYERQEKERWYTDKNIKFRAADVLERQETNSEFLKLVKSLQGTSINELNFDEIKAEVRELDRVSQGEMMELFFGGIGDADYWHRVRPHLRYPYPKIENEDFDPMQDDYDSFDQVDLESDFVSKDLHDL